MSDSRGSVVHFTLAVLLLLLFAIPSPVAAQSPESETTTTTTAPSNAGGPSGLTVSPAIIDNAVDAGVSFVAPVTLSNITPGPVAIQAEAGRFESQQMLDSTHNPAYDIASWFTVSEPMFLLAPNERKTIDVSVNIPANAEPGGHYATIYFQALGQSASSNIPSAQLTARVGVVVFLTVRGELHPSAELIGPIETEKTQLQAGNTDFHFALRNTGNVHFQPSGSLVIEDIFGREVKKLPLPTFYVLPGAERSYDLTWERGMRPGYYTAHISLQAGVALEAESQRFLLLPLILVIPSLFLLVVLVMTILLRRAKKRRAIKRQKALALITAGTEEQAESRATSDEVDTMEERHDG